MKKKITRGSVFQRPYRNRSGELKRTKRWYVKYYANGKPVVLPTETEDYDEALTFLRKRMAAADEQKISDLPERVTMGQLFDLLLSWYRRQGRRTTYDLECLMRPVDKDHERPGPLREYFGLMKARAVGSAAIARYTSTRLAEKPRPANGTVNKALAYVRRAMKLGALQDPPLVLRVPPFEMLPEAEPRNGLITHDMYRAVRDHLPGYARIALVIGYHTGARKGAILKIRREWIDLKKGRIELALRSAENKRAPRFLPIYGDMAAELNLALSVIDEDNRKAAKHRRPECPLLVQRNGRPVHDFEKVWTSACKLAGAPAALFHDLRRTALTNMIEAGLSEKEAMEISGHRTRAVFDRYHIVSERRLREMAGKMEAHLKTKESATVSDSGVRRPS